MCAMPKDNQNCQVECVPGGLEKNSLEKVTHGLTYLTREVGTNVKHVELLVMLLYFFRFCFHIVNSVIGVIFVELPS